MFVYFVKMLQFGSFVFSLIYPYRTFYCIWIKAVGHHRIFVCNCPFSTWIMELCRMYTGNHFNKNNANDIAKYGKVNSMNAVHKHWTHTHTSVDRHAFVIIKSFRNKTLEIIKIYIFFPLVFVTCNLLW